MKFVRHAKQGAKRQQSLSKHGKLQAALLLLLLFLAILYRTFLQVILK